MGSWTICWGPRGRLHESGMGGGLRVIEGGWLGRLAFKSDGYVSDGYG
jgi:hypothetical protein